VRTGKPRRDFPRYPPEGAESAAHQPGDGLRLFVYDGCVALERLSKREKKDARRQMAARRAEVHAHRAAKPEALRPACRRA
jgi:hypothetical protein